MQKPNTARAQALNDIFEKIAPLNIHERHLLRLGHDADKLETEEDFSKYGRVQVRNSSSIAEIAPKKPQLPRTTWRNQTGQMPGWTENVRVCVLCYRSVVVWNFAVCFVRD